MKAEKIRYDNCKVAISKAFEGDSFLIKMYDPNVSVKSLEEIVENVCAKVKQYNEAGSIHLFGVYEKKELIGYFVCSDFALISFGLNIKYRIRKYLRDFFSIIKRQLNGNFIAYLYSRNQRAIKWLLKNGMKIEQSDYLITKLTF